MDRIPSQMLMKPSPTQMAAQVPTTPRILSNPGELFTRERFHSPASLSRRAVVNNVR